MQDERSMILNMLKEGKISVEEAEALLEVLNEGTKEEPGGFAAADSEEPSVHAHGERKHDPHKVIFTIDASDEEHRTAGDGKRDGKSRGFSFDFGGLKDSLRETMKGVSEAVKDVMSELSDLDLGNEIFRAMGKIRSEASDEITESVGEASRLSISNKWGDIRVTGDDASTDVGAFAGSVTVRAKIAAWGRSRAEADEAIAKVGVRLEQEGETWHVRSGLEKASLERVRVDYEITLPRRMGVSVSTASGDIWIEELDGEQSIKTLSGDITVADLGSDPATAQVMKTKSGDVVGGALTGEISLSSLSGDVEINGFSGTLQVATQSGDITIQDGSGSVQLKTMSGDIDAALGTLGEKPIKITSVSGDIELEIPDDSAVDMTAKSVSGEVDVDIEMDVVKRTEHLVVGAANGGGLELSATSVSGDITIQES
ncbi:MAG: DUF4097 family beta strand repeat-containing protein [Spirochaetia bacterium]